MNKRENKRKVQQKLDLINRSKERMPMMRPVVFKDKTKYDWNRQKAGDRYAHMSIC